jgi:alkanesulfonate monooxygenase SsuD/methylene tetrahydromethanopterin reductase-like flavin-dependent oxidoreductase (luciferase family)
MPSLALPPADFRDELRKIEDSGFDTVAVSEHLSLGWWMEPITALLTACHTNPRLRLLSLVLCNDFRHPVILHKMAASLDMLTGGRLELGLGAGWMADDYDAAGIPFAAAVRIALLPSRSNCSKLFGPAPCTFGGRHYQVALDGQPKPVQHPHPPILIGGGRRAVLGLAAPADIVGVLQPPFRGAGPPPWPMAARTCGESRLRLRHRRDVPSRSICRRACTSAWIPDAPWTHNPTSAFSDNTAQEPLQRRPRC